LEIDDMSLSFRMSGSARGSCVHRHNTIAGAAKCAERYERDCDSEGRYSDRRLVVLDEHTQRDPTETERMAFAAALENVKSERESRPAPFRPRS
jgi:hypothetical protein